MEKQEIAKTAKSCLRVVCYLVGFWLLFMAIHTFVPFIRSGHVVIYEAKCNLILSQPILNADSQHRVLIFGDSQILSGFVPSYFDELSGGTVASYNLGLPNFNPLVKELETVLAEGSRPTDVFITLPWVDQKDAARPSDGQIITNLFPFRRMVRDAVLFCLRSRTRGGIAQFYEFSRKSKKKMLHERGYYFIEGQSHFPNDRLPEDFSLETDTPERLLVRDFSIDNETFERLCELSEQYGIRYYIIPVYCRQGQFAPSLLPNEELSKLFASQNCFTILGPDYFSFPNSRFADSQHLNPEGAREYTKRLHEIFQQYQASIDKPSQVGTVSLKNVVN